MSWKRSKFASSLLSLLGDPPPTKGAQVCLTDIRQAMLDCLSGVSPCPHQTKVWARVLYAPDIQALWYLRGDLMTLLAGPLGESAAKAQLQTISDMFDGLLPAAQKVRPNRLGR